MSNPERLSFISGVGRSASGRRLGRTAMDLTLDAALEAIADAGLTRDDIDGIATYPGGDAIMSRGFGGPSASAVQDALRLDINYLYGSGEGSAQLGSIIEASSAIAAGLAKHVLVFRTVTESTMQGMAGRNPGGGMQRMGGFLMQFGAVSATNWFAQVAQLHMHKYGTTREQLAQIALTCRTNAGVNPRAVYRDPLTMDDYLNARMISTPLCLLDCDVPVDGSTAMVVSHVDYAKDAPHIAAHINAVGTAQIGRPSWDQYEDMTSMLAQGVSKHLWSRTDLKPADVDVAELYDGFSIITLAWLEALGFCEQGEGGAFIEGGQRIARTGELPINTHGGQLSEGRLHGYGHVYEAVVQLRGDAGERQIPGAEVIVAANGGGPIAGAMLLTKGIRD
ncbi:MAG: thiolase family protein [Candidatus Nanopelagicales bacterium]|nr:thiolase family protein [Candidatus Nanopelagicales bacterium]